MRRTLSVWVLMAAAGAAGAAVPGHGFDVTGIDTTASPCQDFYQYANGKWLASHPIPADQGSMSTGYEIYNRNQIVLHEILNDAAADTTAPRNSIKGKVGRFFRAGMDTARIQREGAKPLAPEFARIAAIRNTSQLMAEIGRLHRMGAGPLFGEQVIPDLKVSTVNLFYVGQGGLGLPDRDYYLKTDAPTKAVRAAYVPHVVRMFRLLGEPPARAKADAATVMAMETRLAKASMTLVEQRDPRAQYHKMPVSGLVAFAPGAPWRTYFAAVGLPHPAAINVAQPKFFAEAGRMVATVPLADWKTYLRWHLIHTAAPCLSDAFYNENFRFFSTTLNGVKKPRPRWKRVAGITDNAMGEALGQLYVAKAFPPEAKRRARAMILNLKAALRDRITQLDWMGDATRAQALRKLDAMTVKVGYPDKWRDYSALKAASPDYVINIMEANAFEFDRNLRKIGRPVDRSEWGMSPPTVDAYSNPLFNEVVFPAGILQPPFFDAKADDASNYGGMGAIIGHELTHGFDDQGRRFDAEGNLKDWWTAADAKAFQARADVMAKQYDAYEPVTGAHINGHLTLGENIADTGGVKIAYLALQKALEGKPRPLIDGFTPDQRFFLAYAQNWRANERPESVRTQIATDPHSPARFRVVGPLANVPEFRAAFGCPDPAAGTLSAQVW